MWCGGGGHSVKRSLASLLILSFRSGYLSLLIVPSLMVFLDLCPGRFAFFLRLGYLVVSYLFTYAALSLLSPLAPLFLIFLYLTTTIFSHQRSALHDLFSRSPAFSHLSNPAPSFSRIIISYHYQCFKLALSIHLSSSFLHSIHPYQRIMHS